MSFDTYFMRIAEIVKEKSDCPRRKVGAVYVVDRRIAATGYNQSPSKVKHCSEVGCLMKNGHCIRSIHGEVNGILNAVSTGQQLANSTLYVTSFPCLRCLKAIRNAKVRRIVYKDPYEYDAVDAELFAELQPLFEWEQYA